MITTSGFQPTNFPTYQPVNPSLLAFNPQNVVEGALGPGRVYLISTEIQLASGDQISATVSASDTAGTVTWTVSANDTYLSGYKLKNL